jgi:hypothetical protein
MRQERTWSKVVAAGGAEGLPPELRGCAQFLASEAPPGNAPAPVEAKALIRNVRFDRREGLMLVLLNRELCAGGVASVFGFADRRKGVAVVSSARLRDPESDKRTAHRIANVVAHELGHLNGYSHCRDSNCLMHPATEPSDVDARGLALCDRCRNRPELARLIPAALFCLLVFFGIDTAARLLPELAPSSPFTVRAAIDSTQAQLLFNGHEVFSSAALREHGSEIAGRLNASYRKVQPPPVGSTPVNATQASVLLNGEPLLEVGPSDARSASPAVVASQWAQSVDQLLRAKGMPGQSCPECHINRYRQVVAWSEKLAR